MYPKVFKDYAEHRREFGDVLLPTSPFFYGLQDRKRSPSISIRARPWLSDRPGDQELPDEEGKIKVFFELNGQPRTVRIAKPGAVGVEKVRLQADAGNSKHIGAPMPGMVVMVSVKPGQRVARGAPLLSIEAMKMETVITADRDALIKHVQVKPGDVIAAKDLLIEID